MATPFLGMLGTTELILVLVIVVVVFGVGKLPQVGRQLGEGIRNFKKEVANEDDAEAGDAPHSELPPASEQSVPPRDVTEEHRV